MWVLGAWEKPLLCPLLLSVPILTLGGIAELSSGILMTTSCPPHQYFPLDQFPFSARSCPQTPQPLLCTLLKVWAYLKFYA